MKKALIIAIASVFVAGIAYAATVPSEPAIYDSVLSAPLGSSDTTIYLKSASTTQGGSLTGYNCFTIDVNTPTLEYVCGTVSGTTVTGLVRNLDFFTGTTTNSNTSVPSHRTGSDIRITDFPYAQIVSNIFGGKEVIPSVLHYVTGTTISGSDSYALSDIGYVNSVVAAGCANSSLTVNGCSQIATQIQMASSTATGSTGGNLVIWSDYSTSTPGSAGLWNVISLNDGKLSPAWLNGSLELYTFNGGVTSNSTTTIAASSTLTNALILNGQKYAFPVNENASSSALQTDGNGNLSWENTGTYRLYTNNAPGSITGGSAATTTIFQVSVPAKALGTNNTLECKMPISQYSESGPTTPVILEAGYGTASTTIQLAMGSQSANLRSGVIYTLDITGNGATNSQQVWANAFGGPVDASQNASSTSATSTESQDSTGALNLTVQAKGVGGSDTFVPYNVICQIIR